MNPDIRIRQQVLVEQFHVLEWKSDSLAYLECPGQNFHTNRNSKRDCRVVLEGSPTINCFHSSCSEVIEVANFALRSAIGKLESKLNAKILRSTKSKNYNKSRTLIGLKQRSGNALESILKDFPWDPIDVWENSPIKTDNVEQESHLMLSLFPSDDVVWIGKNIYESGSPRHIENFRSSKSWLTMPLPLGLFICPSVFKPNSFSRSNENVVKRRFLVIESDVLNHSQICSVFLWCLQFLKLRAIVDTGGKSLHGWFDFPNEEIFSELKIILPQFKCDRALFTPCQPCRLPGVHRGDCLQKLLWFGESNE